MSADDWSYKKTPEEIESALVRQIEHLRRSAKLYDEGEFSEAERLATAVCNIVHDPSKRTRSLLTQVGFKEQLLFLQSCPPQIVRSGNRRIAQQATPLCSISWAGGAAFYKPHLGNVPGLPEIPMVKFSKWWEGIIYLTHAGLTLSRKNLVCSLRDQDGGSHVDPELRDRSYHWLATKGDELAYYNGNTIGFSFSLLPGGGVAPGNPPSGAKRPDNAHWATMRQVAWEVDESLKQVGY